MKKSILILFLASLAHTVFAQKKLIQKLFSNEKDTTRKASFMPVPVLGYAQETGFEIGLGALYSLYLDRKDTTNRSSNFSGTASYATKKTYNLSLRGDIWSKGNIYHTIADVRLRKMNFDFFGIGNNTNQADADNLIMQQIRLNLDLEKAIFKNVYTGVSIGFEDYKFTDKVVGGIFTSGQNIVAKTGGSVLFLGISQSYDTRNSNNYPTKGFFGRISYQYAPNIFGKNNFTGNQIKLNVRNFWPFGTKIVLGLQGFYQTISDNKTPFYLLQQMGNDEIMRGYYNGRYRDNNLIAAQAELRYRFSNRFGLAAFTGTGKVYANNSFSLAQFKPNYGAGFRYFFDPAKGLSVRLDYGIGQKNTNEEKQSGFYISLAEAF